jgi:hypothetical protein
VTSPAWDCAGQLKPHCFVNDYPVVPPWKHAFLTEVAIGGQNRQEIQPVSRFVARNLSPLWRLVEPVQLREVHVRLKKVAVFLTKLGNLAFLIPI